MFRVTTTIESHGETRIETRIAEDFDGIQRAKDINTCWALVGDTVTHTIKEV